MGDDAFLRSISELIGKYEHETVSYSQTLDQYGGRVWMPTIATEERYRITIDRLNQGHQHDPDAAMILRPGGKWGWVRMMAYYRSMPWPMVIAKGVEFALKTPRLAQYPLPDLDQKGDQRYLYEAGGEHLVTYWNELKRRQRILAFQSRKPPRELPPADS